MYLLVYKTIISDHNDTLVIHMNRNYKKRIVRRTLKLLTNYIYNSSLIEQWKLVNKY